jgi:hypothetical protein
MPAVGAHEERGDAAAVVPAMEIVPIHTKGNGGDHGRDEKYSSLGSIICV